MLLHTKSSSFYRQIKIIAKKIRRMHDINLWWELHVREGERKAERKREREKYFSMHYLLILHSTANWYNGIFFISIKQVFIERTIQMRIWNCLKLKQSW